MKWDGNGYVVAHTGPTGDALAAFRAERVEIPSGLCGVHGCVFPYGHRGLHSWAKKRR